MLLRMISKYGKIDELEGGSDTREDVILTPMSLDDLITVEFLLEGTVLRRIQSRLI